MEIKIKTHEEITSERVTFEVTAESRREAVAVCQRLLGSGFTGERLYTASEVADLQASEAELVTGPLREKVRDLMADRDRKQKQAQRNEEWAERAEKLVGELTLERNQLSKELAACIEVQNQVEIHAGRETALNESLTTKLAATERLLRQATHRLGEVTRAVTGPRADAAITEWPEDWVDVLVEMVKAVRTALESTSET